MEYLSPTVILTKLGLAAVLILSSVSFIILTIAFLFIQVRFSKYIRTNYPSDWNEMSTIHGINLYNPTGKSLLKFIFSDTHSNDKNIKKYRQKLKLLCKILPTLFVLSAAIILFL